MPPKDLGVLLTTGREVGPTSAAAAAVWQAADGVVLKQPGQTTECLIRLSELQGLVLERQVHELMELACARGPREGDKDLVLDLEGHALDAASAEWQHLCALQPQSGQLVVRSGVVDCTRLCTPLHIRKGVSFVDTTFRLPPQPLDSTYDSIQIWSNATLTLERCDWDVAQEQLSPPSKPRVPSHRAPAPRGRRAEDGGSGGKDAAQNGREAGPSMDAHYTLVVCAGARLIASHCTFMGSGRSIYVAGGTAELRECVLDDKRPSCSVPDLEPLIVVVQQTGKLVLRDCQVGRTLSCPPLRSVCPTLTSVLQAASCVMDGTSLSLRLAYAQGSGAAGSGAAGAGTSSSRGGSAGSRSGAGEQEAVVDMMRLSSTSRAVLRNCRVCVEGMGEGGAGAGDLTEIGGGGAVGCDGAQQGQPPPQQAQTRSPQQRAQAAAPLARLLAKGASSLTLVDSRCEGVYVSVSNGASLLAKRCTLCDAPTEAGEGLEIRSCSRATLEGCRLREAGVAVCEASHCEMLRTHVEGSCKPGMYPWSCVDVSLGSFMLLRGCSVTARYAGAGLHPPTCLTVRDQGTRLRCQGCVIRAGRQASGSGLAVKGVSVLLGAHAHLSHCALLSGAWTGLLSSHDSLAVHADGQGTLVELVHCELRGFGFSLVLDSKARVRAWRSAFMGHRKVMLIDAPMPGDPQDPQGAAQAEEQQQGQRRRGQRQQRQGQQQSPSRPGSTQGVGGRGAGASGATEQQVSFKACFCPVTAALRAVIMPGEKLPIVLHMDGVAGTAASAEQALGRPLFTWAAVEGPHNNTRPCCACCGTPHLRPNPLRLCGRCRCVHYCGEACAAAHWTQHRQECGALGEAKAAAARVAAGAVAAVVARAAREEVEQQKTLQP